MPKSPDLFDKIVESLDESKARAKKPMGRPKSARRVQAEKVAAQKEFIDNYESIRPDRPEPKRMVVALSFPEDQQLAALEDAMNARQLAFCKEYVIDFNTTQAAIRAGYAAKNAHNTGYQLLSYRGIRRLIELYTQSNAQKITAIDKDYVIQKVTEIVSTANKDSDKLRGLELLARYLGMFVDRTEITGKDGEAIRIEETKLAADEVSRQLRSMASRATPLSVINGGKKDQEASNG